MRRQGSSSPQNAPSNSTFFAPSPLQNNVPENNGNKFKKGWSDRLKFGKGDKEDCDSDNGYLLQEYRDKYGTLSNGSALCKSMKYAETWLYGSVSVRSPSGAAPRPNLFMYHHPPPPVTVIPEASQHNVILGSPPTTPVSNYAIIMCSCPDFINGTQRGKKSSAVCKKCGGSRVLWGIGTGGGTVRAPGHVMIAGTGNNGLGGTVRLGPNSQTRTRPSLFNISSISSKPPAPQKSSTPDPYDLMRRNRLGSVTPTETTQKFSLANGSTEKSESGRMGFLRARARSTSPCNRNGRRSPSPIFKTSRQPNIKTERVSRKDLEEWEDDTNTDILDITKRKSILECDVNAYELIAKYLKNKEKLRLSDDSLHVDTLTSDDDVLDELSDNMSDNDVENVSKNSQSPNVERISKSSKLKKTDNCYSPKKPENMKKSRSLGNLFTGEKFLKSSEKVPGHNSGITIGGQKIKIFNDVPSATRIEDDEYVTDDVLSDTTENSHAEKISQEKATPKSSSHIPRLASPRRPPRKLKGSCNPEKKVLAIDRPKSCEEPGMSDSKNTASPPDACTTIKSILKKPSKIPPRGPEHSQLMKTFGDINLKPDCNASSSIATSTSSLTSVLNLKSPSPLTNFTCTDGQSHFYLPTFQEYKQQNRKKKQVQFKVGDDRGPQLQQVHREERQQEVKEQGGAIPIPKRTVVPRFDRPNVSEPGKKVKHEKETESKVTKSARCDDDSSEVVNSRNTNNNISKTAEKCTDTVQSNKDIAVRETAKEICNADNENEKTVASPVPDKNTVYFGQYGVSEAEVESAGTLRRSLSERLSATFPSPWEKQPGVVFNDTMRLRMRSSRRPDARQVFSDPGIGVIKQVALQSKKRPQRVISPPRPRPKEPPPPPPTLSAIPPPQPDLPPRQKYTNTPNKTSPQQKPSLPPPPPIKPRPSSWSPPHLTTQDTGHKSDDASPPKSHRSSDPGPPPSVLKLKVLSSDNSSLLGDVTADVSTNMGKTPTSDNTDSNRTIVSVSSPVLSSRSRQDVHRLQIRNEKDNAVPVRGTSILINGKPSSGQIYIDEGIRNTDNISTVTINVGGQTNLSPLMRRGVSCTVIDTTEMSSINNNSSYDSSRNHNTNKTTTIIPISPDVTDQRTLVILDHKPSAHSDDIASRGEDGHSRSASSDCSNITVTTTNESNKNVAEYIKTPSEKIGSRRASYNDSSSSLEDEDALLDPVEAVKRNLVPHVCGKSDCDSSNQLHYACSESIDDICEKLKGEDYFLARACSKIVDVLAVTPEEDRDKLNESDTNLTNENEIERIEHLTDNFDDVSSEPSPLLPPRFIIDDTDEIEHKGYLDEDENCYESIKDPIYEEIPDTPPPLPLSPPPSLSDLDEKKRVSKSIFEGASKYDILSYLEGAKERGIIIQEETYFSGSSTNGDESSEILDDKDLDHPSHDRMSSLDLGDLSSRVSHLSNTSDSSEENCNLIITNLDDDPSSGKARKSSAEIERNDSGVGSETSKSSRSRWQHGSVNMSEDQQHLCEDCDQLVETEVTACGVMYAPLVCRKCAKKRAERKETIAEIVETEEKYGRDLKIILEEFYRPMMVAGLLTTEQLGAIFLNSEELLDHNVALAEKLRDALEIALEQGDEDLLTVNIGRLFLEASPMLHAFESYCVRQAAASVLLANLEKEKELLRIFLRVSQMENTVLRRMNLNSFLMVPVQRVTKYPLLLARLYKVTPAHHQGRELLKQAQHKIELHLEHMNAEAKDLTSTRIWRRISIASARRSSSEIDMINIKLRKMALDILEWNHDEARFVMEGKLLYTNPTDNNWRKGRTIKLHPVNALLVTNGKPTEEYHPDLEEELLMFPRHIGVREATLLLLKEKCGRYALVREPLYLDKCIVCCESDWEDYFEVQELVSRDTFIFKAEDGERTKAWYRQLQYHAQGLGTWRRRRNALANIMINGMLTRN